MEQGLLITGVGMTIVFTVLLIIYIGIVILGVVERAFPMKEAVLAGPGKSESARSHSSVSGMRFVNDEEMAAIKAALSHHLDLKDDDFDIKIKK